MLRSLELSRTPNGCLAGVALKGASVAIGTLVVTRTRSWVIGRGMAVILQ